MRRIFAIGLLVSLLLTGCALPERGKQQHQATFLDLFDTVTTISGMTDSEENFRQRVGQIHDVLQRYHQLFDIYNEYPGLNNRTGYDPLRLLSPASRAGRTDSAGGRDRSRKKLRLRFFP